MRHRFECPTRWADLDVLGHVNNVVYADYLQEARVDMLRAHAGRVVSGADGEGLVVARHEITYRRPLLFDFAPVSVECWVSQLRAASFTMGYEIFLDGPGPGAGGRTVFAQARTLLSPFVFAEGRPRRLDAAERDGLTGFLEPDEPPRGRGPRTPDEAPVGVEVEHYRLDVRFSDLDAYGHVNNVTYLEYLQEARLAFMNRLWGHLPGGTGGHGEDGSREHPGLVVAQADIDYLRPLTLRVEPYDVQTWIARVGRTSMTFGTAVRDGEETMARGQVVVVFVDGEGAATPPSTDQRAALERSLTAGC